MRWTTFELQSVVVLDRQSVHPSDADADTAYVGLEHVDGEGRIEQAETVASAELKSNKFAFGDQHVLFGKLRPYLRKIARPTFSGVCSTDIIPLRVTDQLSRDYLYHFLRTPTMVDLATSRCSGANLPRLSPKQLATFPIPLPPLAEQKRIARILDAADALRAKRREAIAQLDTLLQSTFLDMFGDPVTNPMGWEQSSLGKLCDVGSSKRVFVNDLVEEGVPFYRGTEVGLLGEGEAVSPSLFITHDHYEQLKRHSGVPRPGDLLVPSICHDGRIFIVRDNKPFYFKDGRVLWIKSGESDINSAFLRYHLKAVFFSEYSKIASGTTFAELKIFALKNLVVHVPPRDEQNRFTNFVESIERQKARMRAHLAELDALFASLQSRAFNGEL